MYKVVEVRVSPGARDINAKAIQKATSSYGHGKVQANILKRSIDARGARPLYRFRVEVFDDDGTPGQKTPPQEYLDVHNAPAVHIIGSGPAGYFAALKCLEHGMKPVILERGKDVQTRRRDLKAIQQEGKVNPDSNYCFGEGGAGTYSDGKLYTRATKRGNVDAVLKTLVAHGANPDILIDAHPHIGSNKLPKVIAAIRATIESHGGEIKFEHKVTDIIIKDRSLQSIVLHDGTVVRAGRVILATGHSARDIHEMLDRQGVRLDFKGFAIGVRIEHPQPLIDKIQYGIDDRGDLPAASYRLSCQVGEQGVFSFCMCPGGLVVPSATNPGEIVVNGMSLSRRDSPYANAGTVVAIGEKQIRETIGMHEERAALSGIALQRQVEQACFALGDGSQQAPAQRLMDFLDGKISESLPSSSYIPGLHSADVATLFPEPILNTLKAGVRQFGQKMRDYLTNEAVVIATESRTSSPVRIPRDATTFMHPDVAGLYPCGEGAGYAGGIVSAALDGINVALAVAKSVKS